jgi:hypothetical protein
MQIIASSDSLCIESEFIRSADNDVGRSAGNVECDKLFVEELKIGCCGKGSCSDMTFLM